VNLAALVFAAAAMVAMFRFKLGMFVTLAACSLGGVAYYVITSAL
jgi:chromate transporter